MFKLFTPFLAPPLVAPYIDVASILNDDYLVRINKATGLKAVTLAFALADNGNCVPTWGGVSHQGSNEHGLSNNIIMNAIKNFQYIGGSVILATGGAMGPYLESACTSPESLARAWKQTLDYVGTDYLDIDIGN